MQQPAFRVAGIGAAALLLVLAGAPRIATGQEAAWLGVYTQTIDEDLREGLDFDGEGILVTRVVTDSPAQRAGVRKGDILMSLNDRRIESPSALMSEVRSFRSGQRVSLEVFRDGARRTLAVTLGSRPDDDDEPVAPAPPAAPRAPGAPRIETFEMPEGSWMFPMGRGRLGVRVESVSPDLAEALEVESGGALVVEVIDDTPAKRAGLKAGDVIVRVADQRIDDSGELTKALHEREAGPVAITVARRGATRTLTATLEEAPQSMRWERGPTSWGMAPRARRMDADSRRDLEREIRQLREEMRKLQEQMEDREGN